MNRNGKIEKAIKVTDWIKPSNQLVMIFQCFIRFDFLLNKTGEWKRFDFCSPAVINEREANKMTVEQLEEIKKIKIDYAKKTLIKLFHEIKETKEHFFPKNDETLYIEEGDDEDVVEEAKFNSNWAKAGNEAKRAIAYKETDEGFYVKIDDIRVTE